MTRKILGIIVCIAAVIAQAGAQGLDIQLDGGLQGTKYTLQKGKNTLLPGGSLSILYTFRLSKNLDFLTGITGGVYRTQATLPDGVVFSDYQVDDAGSAFQYGVASKGYKETQQFFAAGLPLLLQFHTVGAGTQWYINGGGKILFPTGTTTNITARQLTLSGYYPDFNVTVSNLPQHGFGTVNNWKASSSTEWKPMAAVTMATGVSFSLSPGARLYAGIYIDYGVTSLRSKRDTMPLITYNSSGVTEAKANGVLNTAYAGQVTSLSYGLQVRLSFGSARSAARSKTKSKTAIQPPPTNPPLATTQPSETKPTSTTNPPSPINPPAPTKQPSPAVLSSQISDDEADLVEKPVVIGIMGETAVPDDQKPHLDQVAKIMLKYPALRISVVGHTCNSGTDMESPKLGLARAKAVEQYLRTKGINRHRMDVSGTAQSDPVRADNPAVNYRNRRVVITLK